MCHQPTTQVIQQWKNKQDEGDTGWLLLVCSNPKTSVLRNLTFFKPFLNTHASASGISDIRWSNIPKKHHWNKVFPVQSGKCWKQSQVEAVKSISSPFSKSTRCELYEFLYNSPLCSHFSSEELKVLEYINWNTAKSLLSRGHSKDEGQYLLKRWHPFTVLGTQHQLLYL